MKRLRQNKSLLLLLIMVLTIGIVGCSNNEKPAEKPAEKPVAEILITDDADQKIQLEKPAEKVVSLAPSITESLFAIGLDDEIVGVTEYCDYPKEALDKEKVATFKEANMEKILATGAELVIHTGNLDEENAKTLKEAGMKVVLLDPQNIDSVNSTLERLGVLTGKTKEAEKLIGEIKSKKEEIVDIVSAADKKTVFYEIWHEPLMAAGPGSFMAELIDLAGGENVAADAEAPYAEYSLEKLIEKNPKVYLSADDGEKTVEDIKAREGYDNIDAVKNGEIHLLDANIVSRSGPRIIEALELVAKAIHPDLF